MGRKLVDVKSLKKQYGEREVIRGISFSIYAREVLAMIGPNGAGKTTTVEMILGMRNPDSGSIQLDGLDRKKDMGAQLQNTPFFYHLSVEENIRIFCNFYNIRNREEMTKKMLTLFELDHVKKAQVYTLSGGQKKRLAIALATLHNPKIVFLDEPTADLDPRGRIKMRKIIRQLALQGHSVVFTSHDMNEVVQVADRVLLIDNGRIVEAGAPQQIMEKYNASSLEEVYMILTEKYEGEKMSHG